MFFIFYYCIEIFDLVEIDKYTVCFVTFGIVQWMGIYFAFNNPCVSAETLE